MVLPSRPSVTFGLSEQVDSFFKPGVVKESPLDLITEGLTSIKLSETEPTRECSEDSQSPNCVKKVHKYTKWLEERQREDDEIIRNRNRKVEEIDTSSIGRSIRQHVRQSDIKRKRSDAIHEDKREKFFPKSRRVDI